MNKKNLRCSWSRLTVIYVIIIDVCRWHVFWCVYNKQGCKLKTTFFIIRSDDQIIFGVLHCAVSSLSSTKTTANWYVDSHWTAIGENGPGKRLTVHGIVFANFKSGLYCASLPLGKATTICLPFGLQQAQLKKYLKSHKSKSIGTEQLAEKIVLTHRAFSDLSIELYSKLLSLIIYAPNVPSPRQRAIVFPITGFQRISVTLTFGSFDTINLDTKHLTFCNKQQKMKKKIGNRSIPIKIQ